MASGPRAPVSAGPLRLLPVVLIAAVILRAFAWAHTLMMTSDGPDFLWQAQRMLAGDWADALAHHYHPLYAFLSAGAGLLLGDVVAGAVLVSVAAGVAAVAAVVALARRALPGRPDIALAAALLATVHSASLLLSSDVRSDGLHAALFVLCAAALLAALEQGGWRWLAAGAAAGLAYLTRPEALFLVAPGLLAALATVPRRGVAAAARGALGFALALALVAAPYVLAIHHLTGSWQISMKPSIAAAGLATSTGLPPGCPLASPTVPGLGARAEDDGAPAGPAEPATETVTAAATASRLGTDLRLAIEAFADVARADVLFFAALGLLPFLRGRRGLVYGGLSVVAGWIALLALHHHRSGYMDDRHLLPAALLVLPAAGAGWLMLWNAPRARTAARVVCLAVVALLAIGGVKPRHVDERPLLAGLAFARDLTPEGQRIVVERRKEGWYAGRPVLLLELPCTDEALRAAMRREGAALVVLDEDSLRAAAPHWLDGSLFELLVRFREGRQSVVVLALRG